jgi:hypothetical protein
MNPKAITTGICALLFMSQLHADEFWFLPERFSSITLVTTKGKECVAVEAWTKEEGSKHKVFESTLTRTGMEIYTTPNGTIFTLKKLDRPTVNDGNRHINSGDWQLTVSGKGSEFNRLKKVMPEVSFGDTPPLTYLGTKKN